MEKINMKKMKRGYFIGDFEPSAFRTDAVEICSKGASKYTLDAGYYQWHAFPFQFCSVPMFVAFIAPLLKDGKVKRA